MFLLKKTNFCDNYLQAKDKRRVPGIEGNVAHKRALVLVGRWLLWRISVFIMVRRLEKGRWPFFLQVYFIEQLRAKRLRQSSRHISVDWLLQVMNLNRMYLLWFAILKHFLQMQPRTRRRQHLLRRIILRRGISLKRILILFVKRLVFF